MKPKDVKVVNDQNFVKIPRSVGCQSFRTILVAVSDGAINARCDLMKSNGYAKLVKLRDEAVADMLSTRERAAALAELPQW